MNEDLESNLTKVFKQYNNLNLAIYIGIQMLYVSYIIILRPFKITKDNIDNIINEIVYLFLCILLYDLFNEGNGQCFFNS